MDVDLSGEMRDVTSTCSALRARKGDRIGSDRMRRWRSGCLRLPESTSLSLSAPSLPTHPPCAVCKGCSTDVLGEDSLHASQPQLPGALVVPPHHTRALFTSLYAHAIPGCFPAGCGVECVRWEREIASGVCREREKAGARGSGAEREGRGAGRRPVACRMCGAEAGCRGQVKQQQQQQGVLPFASKDRGGAAQDRGARERGAKEGGAQEGGGQRKRGESSGAGGVRREEG
eukprot:499987-Rhodomonas_salina.1